MTRSGRFTTAVRNILLPLKCPFYLIWGLEDPVSGQRQPAPDSGTRLQHAQFCRALSRVASSGGVANLPARPDTTPSSAERFVRAAEIPDSAPASHGAAAARPARQDVSVLVEADSDHVRQFFPELLVSGDPVGDFAVRGNWVRVFVRAEKFEWVAQRLAAVDRPFIVERPGEFHRVIEELARRLLTAASSDPTAGVGQVLDRQPRQAVPTRHRLAGRQPSNNYFSHVADTLHSEGGHSRRFHLGRGAARPTRRGLRHFMRRKPPPSLTDCFLSEPSGHQAFRHMRYESTGHRCPLKCGQSS